MTIIDNRIYALVTWSLQDYELGVRCRRDDGLSDERWVDDAKEDLEFAKAITDGEWKCY